MGITQSSGILNVEAVHIFPGDSWKATDKGLRRFCQVVKIDHGVRTVVEYKVGYSKTQRCKKKSNDEGKSKS